MAATLQAPGERLPLDNTMGVMWIGVLISAVLYGVSLGQTLYYLNRYPNDVWYLKWLVGLTVLFDSLHLAMISHTVYHYTITNYYDFQTLNFLTWSVLAEAIPTGVTGSMVQLFYVARIFRLSKRNYWISGFITLIVIANSACGTAWVIISLQLKTYTELLKINPLTISINALSAAADVLIAAILCFLLARSKTGFRRTDTMISKLINFTANTGLATSVCALASLISLVASPNTLIYALFYFCIGRLYTNSLLVALNARKSITSSSAGDSSHIQSIPMSPRPQTNNYLSSRSQNLSIKIETTTKSEFPGDMKRSGVDFEDTDDRSHRDLV
ncbi:hypothetical protein L218DRAFT_907304 [Marasmius fiardii PR-910]|nr:hypothetical protein L218DRAFT_907304 [Marasmius fiardii PR-910]